MKKTNIFPIFYPIGAKYYDKTTPEFKEAYGRPGVYIIFRMKQNDILPVYVGQGKDAGKACLRHFYYYNDTEQKRGGRKDEIGVLNKNFQYRTSFENEKKSSKFFVKFYFIDDPKKRDKKESDLIEALSPKYNLNLNPNRPDPRQREIFENEAEKAADKYEDYSQQIIEEEIEEAPF
jgi:hypothetical protein